MQSNFFPNNLNLRHFRNPPESLGLLDGLGKLERISLDGPPELDSAILVQLLGHQDPLASNLRQLELRFCNLDPAIIAKLIQQACKSLTILTLFLGGRTDTSFYEGDEPPHLCPLIREFCKNLLCLEFAAPTVCTEIFYDDDELHEIKRNCSKASRDVSDNYAIRETVLDCRMRKKTQRRKKRVQNALREAGKHSDIRLETSTELLLDREEEERKRLVQNSKCKWKRKIVGWRGTCAAEPWSELQQGANLAEAGLEWTLASKTSHHLCVYGNSAG